MEESWIADLAALPGAAARDAGDTPREVDLLASLVATGRVPPSRREAARDLLRRAGGLRGLGRLSVPEIRRQGGFTRRQAERIHAGIQLGRIWAARRRCPGDALRSARDVYRRFESRVRDLRREIFVDLLLDGRHRLLRAVPISVGSLSASLVHPREVFVPAIRESAAGLIVFHNHPSGDPTPSREDIDVTRRLHEVGRLVGIPLLDHVVLGDGGYCSILESIPEAQA